ncbi:MAG: VOC family protein [Anaerolineae bacterium]|nr:VOC family protein [Anaerolineae bacterium]
MQNVAPLLPANNVSEAMAWYRDVLGFSDAWLHENGDYATVRRDGAEIHLFQMKIDPKKSDFMVYIRVSEIEKLYEEYKAKKLIHPNAPLQVKPWGQKEFAIGDLNGALLTFGEKEEKANG